MTPFIVYLPNGKILRSGVCQKETFDLQAEKGELVLNSSADPRKSYVVDGKVLALPDPPGVDFEFDYDNKQWVLNIQLAESKVRFQRDQLLASGPDRINQLWWGSMTTEQENSWVAYRQALLDITKQAGYPTEIDWPVKPE